jgi:hypothetical protein
MKPNPIDRHIDGAQRRLTHLAGMGASTEASERRILEAAEARRGVVEADLARLLPRVSLDASAAQTYLDLTAEAGRLAIVIARSRQALT